MLRGGFLLRSAEFQLGDGSTVDEHIARLLTPCALQMDDKYNGIICFALLNRVLRQQRVGWKQVHQKGATRTSMLLHPIVSLVVTAARVPQSKMPKRRRRGQRNQGRSLWTACPEMRRQAYSIHTACPEKGSHCIELEKLPWCVCHGECWPRVVAICRRKIGDIASLEPFM